jgi:hypothetical protein
VNNFTSASFHKIRAQLKYWEEHGSFVSDNDFVKVTAHEFNVEPTTVRMYIFDKELAKEWWINETKGNKETDHE